MLDYIKKNEIKNIKKIYSDENEKKYIENKIEWVKENKKKFENYNGKDKTIILEVNKICENLIKFYNKTIILFCEIYFYFGEGEYVKKIFKMNECISDLYSFVDDIVNDNNFELFYKDKKLLKDNNKFLYDYDIIFPPIINVNFYSKNTCLNKLKI